MTAFKICGITRASDAEAAARAGASAVGVIFAASPRQVNVATARRIVRDLPPEVARVGVFAGQPIDLIVEAVQACALDWVQLSGGEPAAFAREVAERSGARVLRAIHASSPTDLDAHADYPADAFLVDAPITDGRRGGTGRRFDWGILARTGPGDRAASSPLRPERLVVAGGLNPDNVTDAIRRLRPAAVDVCSGVEATPGTKDLMKIRAFAAAVREASAGRENGKSVFA